jgi:hypothetical protein
LFFLPIYSISDGKWYFCRQYYGKMDNMKEIDGKKTDRSKEFEIEENFFKFKRYLNAEATM